MENTNIETGQTPIVKGDMVKIKGFVSAMGIDKSQQYEVETLIDGQVKLKGYYNLFNFDQLIVMI